ncbi:MAG: preprotein translocase subunit SecY [Parcubacteria group bacterium Gr01-1014_31]|nr:MAG: preprotein translocase subunit SecY [Parcubacteria group bacterium Gr01-1014_31]
MLLDPLRKIWKSKDLRNSILYVLALLVVFRLAAHIPLPNVDVTALRDFFQRNQLFGLLNIFSGGAMENFSVVALGVGPYITASIIIQLLTMIIPKMEALSKEGEQGRHKLNQWTRMLTVPLAVLSGYGLIALLQQQQAGGVRLIAAMTSLQLAGTIVTLTAGTIFLMWLGELISEKKVGNGISLLIFAGIVTSIPTAIQQTLSVFDTSQLISVVTFLAVAVVVTAATVFITEAQRNVPVSYARRVRGIKLYGGVNTHLPLRVNQAGMIPIIFAISVVLFPPMIAQFFIQATNTTVARAANAVYGFFNLQANPLGYGVMFFLLVFGFTYFYTEVVFHPEQVAENLQKQGGFIPGIRPGRPTAEYLGQVSNRIVLAGALFLALIAVLPIALQYFTGLQTLTLSGSSLLIVVSVVIETTKQIESQLTMRDYEGW